MTTDFSYGGKQILSGGPFKPTGKDMPSDARTRVESYADITSIPNPYIGLKITVKVDETNNNKMTDYIVKSLKANSSGIPNMAIDEVVKYVDYLGVSSSGGGTSAGTGEGLTTEQAQQLQTAYEHSQSDHVSMEEVNEAIANAQLSGGEVDLSTYATKTYTDNAISTALDGHTFKFLTQAEYDALETKDPLVEYHITDATEFGEGLTSEQAQQLQTAYKHSQSDHVTMGEVNEAIANITIGSGVASIIEYADGDTFSISNSTTQTIEILTDQSSMTFMETGGGDTLGVKLSSAPSSNVTVNLTIANGYCQSNKTSLTFTPSNYNTYQYFTLTGVEDTSSYSDKNDVITLSATGLKNKTINVTISNTTEQPTVNLTSITAAYTQGSTVIYPDTSLDSLKSNLVVKANYSDGSNTTVTDYSLSGSLSEGTSTITVTYQDKNTTFTVNVTARPETVVYTITNNLTNVTNNNSAASIEEQTSYSATLTANSGYTIETVSITMGETDITSTAYSDGTINISSVTGNIVITANATAISSGEEFPTDLKIYLQCGNDNKAFSDDILVDKTSPFYWLDRTENGYNVECTTTSINYVSNTLINYGSESFKPGEWSVILNPINNFAEINTNGDFTIDLECSLYKKNSLIFGWNSDSINAGVSGQFALSFNTTGNAVLRFNYDKPVIACSHTHDVNDYIRLIVIKKGTSVSLYENGELISTVSDQPANVSAPDKLYLGKEINWKYFKLYNTAKNINELEG